MPELSAAIALERAGRLAEAAEVLDSFVAENPKDANATQMLARLRFQTGRHEEALSIAHRAVALDGSLPGAWHTLGLILHLSGDNEQASDALSRATELAPKLAQAWIHRGFVLYALGRPAFARDCYARAIACGTNDPQVHFFMGNALAALGQHEDAVVAYDRALRLQPEFPDAWNNRANSLVALSRVKEAAAAFERSGQIMEAEANGLHGPGSEARVAELARLLQSNGRWSQAISVVSGRHGAAHEFLHALIMPVIFESADMVQRALAHLDDSIAALKKREPNLQDPLREVGLTTFHLPYFGVSDRPIQERVAKLYRGAAPILRFEAGHTPRAGRIRLGVLSAMLREHSVSTVFGGLIERLDPDRFELTYLQVGSSDARSERLAARADSHVRVPENLSEAQRTLAAQNLDMLLFPEVGADALTYFLSLSRFAPRQGATWGHPLTTGSPTMDFFLSCEHLERGDGQLEYSEQLIRLPSLNVFFERPAFPAPLGREDFGLPDDRNLYACLQTAYKMHPDFDRVLAAILERDDRGILVLLQPDRPYFKEVLLRRWNTVCPSLEERCVWIDRMPLDRYLGLLKICDALLAPIQFGGGRSTLDALAVGAPVVTLEGRFLKSRISSAIYHEMGLPDLIATEEPGYVDLAHRLATDSNWNREVRARLDERASVLYRSGRAVEEFNDALQHQAEGL